MAFAMTVTLEPERLSARIELTDIPAGADTYSVYREAQSGSVAGVRGATNAPVTGVTAIARDYELPFDVPLVYNGIAYDGAAEVGHVMVPFQISYGQCEAWLVDLARPTNSLPVMIESMAELEFAVAAGVHYVQNRRAPVMVTLPSWTPSTELVLLTDTEGERDQVRTVLGSGYPFLLRTIPQLGIGNMYLGLTGLVEERFLTPGDAAQRRFRSACVQVERPDPATYVPTPPNTYAHVTATYATYADLKAGVGTYDELAYSWPDDPDLNPIVPWLPDDV